VAIGDNAVAAGFPIVPDTGEEGRVRWGGRELNRTRDFVAQVKSLIPGSRSAYRTASGITSGTLEPNNANGFDGDVYFQIV
jgi:hypothetical protein